MISFPRRFPVSPFFLVLGVLLFAVGCGHRVRSSDDAEAVPRERVALATLVPTKLATVLSQNSVCPGGAVQIGALLTLPDREIAVVDPQANDASFAEVYRPRLAAALASNQYVDISDLEVQVAGPASYSNGYSFSAASDTAAALGGPIRLTMRSRHHESLEPATVAIPISFACEHRFGGGGNDGARAGDGYEGEGASDGTPGGPGGPGEPGQPGGAGPTIEVLAAPVRSPSAAGWIQVVARMEGEAREYLLAPGGRVAVLAMGGSGSAGGGGGAGGPGYDQNFDYERATDGGPGGTGGPGGSGGSGGVIRIIVDPSIESQLEQFLSWSVEGGAAGAGGQGGPGGRGGYFPIEGANGESADGPDGPSGPDGAPGANGEATVETRPMQSLFAIDIAAVEATIAAAADPPDQHFDAAVPASSGGGEAPAAGTATAAAGGDAAGGDAQPVAGTSATPTPTPTPTPAPQPPPEDAARRRLATGRFVLARLTLIGQNGRPVAVVNANGDVEMQGRVVAKFDGGAVLRDGRIVMALERDGTLHIEQGGEMRAMGRIARDGHIRSSDGAEITLSRTGRITSIQGGQRTELQSHFESLPPNARQTAALVVLMASTNLR